jgi:ABC-type antimicrobial peptide transport system permease subunit
VIGLGSLIFTNVRRNLTRSLLTVIGMGIAALVMTTSLTLSEGYPAQAYEAYRAYVGGDILIFQDKVWVRGADINASDPGTWQVTRAAVDLPGPAGLFLPGLSLDGFIAPTGQSRGFFSTSEVAAVTEALAAIEGVNQVRPYFTLPAGQVEFALTSQAVPGQTTVATASWSDTYLRAWPEEQVAAGLGPLISAGRALETSDAGAMVCLVDASRAKLGELEGLDLPSAVPAVGSSIRVLLPRLSVTGAGVPVGDYLDGEWFELVVVGHYTVPTREVTWVNPEAGGDGGAAPPEVERLFLTSPELIVPWTTAQSLLATIAGGTVDMWAQAIAVDLGSLARVETVTAQIAKALPSLSPVSIPALASIANAQFLPEPVYRLPESEWRSAVVPGQVGEPVRVSQAFSVILFAVAALLAAANGIVLVIERQREIAILKAVGAYARDVILMILGEIVLLASIGALSGFVLAEGLAVWNLISNKAGFAAVAVSVGADLIKVLGVTVAFAVVFGLAPALRTTQMTAMEVLRRE